MKNINFPQAIITALLSVSMYFVVFKLNSLFENDKNNGSKVVSSDTILMSQNKNIESNDSIYIDFDTLTDAVEKKIETWTENEKVKPRPIGESVILGNLEIAQFDFGYKMTWYEAQKTCAELGNRWRLPTSKELSFLYEHDKQLNISEEKYWIDSEQSHSYGYGISTYGHVAINRDSEKDKLCTVRAVRNF